MAKEYYEEGRDLPDLQHESKTEGTITSSIGGLGEPSQASFDRLKGFYNTEIIQNPETYTHFLEIFFRSKMRLDSRNTRLQYRACMTEEFFTYLIRTKNPQLHFLESAMKIQNNVLLIYFSHNLESRNADDRDIQIRNQHIQQLSTSTFRPYSQLIHRVVEQGFTLEILQASQHDPTEKKKIIGQLFNLYTRFGWSLKDVEALYANQSNILCVARYNNTIVSAGIGEIADITVGSLQIKLAEITEAATFEEYTRRGLYNAVSCTLLKKLSDMHIDLVFGECNTMSAGVLTVAASQGRTNAIQLLEQYGVFGKGLLIQQVPISDPAGERYSQYNDLLPMFLTSDLLKTYANT